MKNKKTIAVLFAAFGFFGVHRAYLRQYWAIPIYVVLSFLALVPNLNFPLVIALILDAAYFIDMSDEDFNAKFNSEQKSKMLEKFKSLNVILQVLIIVAITIVALFLLGLLCFVFSDFLTAPRYR